MNSPELDQCHYSRNNHSFEMPESLLEAVIKGEVVVFAGAGISTERKIVFPFTFKEAIASKLPENQRNQSFSEIMSSYTQRHDGRRSLLKLLKERFDYIDSFPSLYREATSFHRELATIPQIRTIVTTNWDTYFERECDALPFVTDQDLVYWDMPTRKVIKFHGSINNIGSLIMTTEDYERCYNNLGQSALGGILRTMFATKTILFVGYSFQDEDFIRIYSFLQSTLGELMPHIYIVTLDSESGDSLNTNFTRIVTDGAHFLRILKLRLFERKQMELELTLELTAEIIYKKIRKVHHEEMKPFPFVKYPVLLQINAYQDGIESAIERFYRKQRNGLYYAPGYCLDHADSFAPLKKEKMRLRKYADAAYIQGYQDTLIALGTDPEEGGLKNLPFYFHLGKVKIDSIEKLQKFIKKKKQNISWVNEGRKFIKRHGITSDQIVPQHTPYLF